MHHLRRLAIVVAFLGVVVILLSVLPRALNPTPPSREERRRDKHWVATSPFWLDRQACRWLGICGAHHLHSDPAALPGGSKGGNDSTGEGELRRIELRSLVPTELVRHWLRVRQATGDVKEGWEFAPKRSAAGPEQMQGSRKNRRDTTDDSENSEKSKAETRSIPDYVLKYAPMVHLFSGENFWPSRMDEHLRHMTPYTNGSAFYEPNPLTLDNLFELNSQPNPVFLTSDDDVEKRPEWLHSHMGIPHPFADDDSNDDNYKDTSNIGGESVDPEDFIRKFPGGTTWFSVDRDHPLRRISDPRKLGGLGGPTGPPVRQKGPHDVRSRRIRAESISASAASAASMADPDKQQHPVGSQGFKPDASGYSEAPAILVMVDKGSGILDAFWFFFYSYNLGQTVLKVRYGNHVGDWEHCMIRFEDGVPRALFLSEHAGGQAYAWPALEKFQPRPLTDASTSTEKPPERPVIYSAVGSHAMYAFPGKHPYVLPFEMLADETDKGPLWDPALNNMAYFYDYVVDRDEGGDSKGNDDIEVKMALAKRSLEDVEMWPEHGPERTSEQASNQQSSAPGLSSLTPAASNPDAPTSWFHFNGTWGDELYELGDERQWRLFGQYHYITGPQGPKFKNLDREKVCQAHRCRILYSISDGKKAAWYS